MVRTELDFWLECYRMGVRTYLLISKFLMRTLGRKGRMCFCLIGFGFVVCLFALEVLKSAAEVEAKSVQ